ncbi:MAG TPA: prolyl oligopeptidase family serine peptidase [Bryobacteraceae bacterium]|nr:prolyl oligopeptidase family serine peptidase [Bryobacteraceae bacterium]
MFQSIFRRLRIFALVPAFVLSAQDASLVLRTSVTYRTQRATLMLTEAQKAMADELARQAQTANLAQKYGDAIRSYYHGLAVMRNQEWTPALELASSLEGKLDHALVEPGKPVAITLKPLYASTRATGGGLSASVFLMPGGQSIGQKLPLDSSSLPFHATLTVPEVAPGDYTLEVRLAASDATPAGPFVKSLPVHIESLSAEAAKLRSRLAAITKKTSAAITAEYALALYDRADQSEVNPNRYKWHDEFAAANAILDSVAAGRDPFATRRGDFREAYRSAVDNTLQPYRVYVPAAYDGSHPTPLLVALHGMGGDENSMFDSYNNGTLKREAERVGFIVVAPKGRDTASMYRGSAERDVLDVIAEMQHEYKIDPNRIYLMGHSMGGYGTWSVAIAHPDLFAAIGPISGGGDPAGLLKIRQIPEYVVHGDDDRTVNVNESRRMVEAGKKAGIAIVYVEVPGGSHVSVAAPQFGPMLDFFAKQVKNSAPISAAATGNVAGHYRGEWKGGGGSGALRINLQDEGGTWKCEITFTLSGEDVPAAMRQCSVSQTKLEATYDFTTQGIALRSQTSGEWKANGFVGTYRTTTTDGSSDVDQGTWSASRE